MPSDDLRLGKCSCGHTAHGWSTILLLSLEGSIVRATVALSAKLRVGEQDCLLMRRGTQKANTTQHMSMRPVWLDADPDSQPLCAHLSSSLIIRKHASGFSDNLHASPSKKSRWKLISRRGCWKLWREANANFSARSPVRWMFCRTFIFGNDHGKAPLKSGDTLKATRIFTCTPVLGSFHGGLLVTPLGRQAAVGRGFRWVGSALVCGTSRVRSYGLTSSQTRKSHRQAVNRPPRT